MTPSEWQTATGAYFNKAAPLYVLDVAPVMASLAQKLVEFAHLARGDHVLDLGTGTGVVSQGVKRAGASMVVGLDQSQLMLNYASAHWENDIYFVRADMHQLPSQSDTWSMVLASFALNS